MRSLTSRPAQAQHQCQSQPPGKDLRLISMTLDKFEYPTFEFCQQICLNSSFFAKSANLLKSGFKDSIQTLLTHSMPQTQVLYDTWICLCLWYLETKAKLPACSEFSTTNPLANPPSNHSTPPCPRLLCISNLQTSQNLLYKKIIIWNLQSCHCSSSQIHSESDCKSYASNS